MNKGWMIQAIEDIADELTDIFEEMLKDDFALAWGEKESTREEMRAMFDKMRFTEGATEEFVNQMLAQGRKPEEIIGWIAKEANLAVRRDGRGT